MFLLFSLLWTLSRKREKQKHAADGPRTLSSNACSPCQRHAHLRPTVERKISVCTAPQIHCWTYILQQTDQGCLYLEWSLAEAWRGPGAAAGSQGIRTTPWQLGWRWCHLRRDSKSEGQEAHLVCPCICPMRGPLTEGTWHGQGTDSYLPPWPEGSCHLKESQNLGSRLASPSPLSTLWQKVLRETCWERRVLLVFNRLC